MKMKVQELELLLAKLPKEQLVEAKFNVGFVAINDKLIMINRIEIEFYAEEKS